MKSEAINILTALLAESNVLFQPIRDWLDGRRVCGIVSAANSTAGVAYHTALAATVPNARQVNARSTRSKRRASSRSYGGVVRGSGGDFRTRRTGG